MKKSLLLLMVLVSSSTIFCQTENGKFLISGGTGLQFLSSSQKYVYDGKTQDKSTTTSFTLLPTVGYFVIDNLAVALAGNITTSTDKYDGGKTVSSNIMLVPAAIYFFTMNGKLKPFVQVGAGYSHMSSKDKPDGFSETKTSGGGFVINAGGGISYFLSDAVSVNFGLSLTSAVLTDSDDSKSKLKEINFGGNLGITVFL